MLSSSSKSSDVESSSTSSINNFVLKCINKLFQPFKGTNSSKEYFYFSRFLLMLSQNQLGELHDLIELTYNFINQELMYNTTLQNNLNNIVHYNNINLMSTSKTVVKIQCRAAKGKVTAQHKERCELFTVNENGLCFRHKNRSALEWSSPPEDVVPSTSSLINQWNLNKSSSIVILKKEKNGVVYWPGTKLVVKSFAEPYVVCKETYKDEYEKLDEQDVSYCIANKIPYRVMNLEFNGEIGPPRSLLLQELANIGTSLSFEDDQQQLSSGYDSD
jgi:hypothetical protein